MLIKKIIKKIIHMDKHIKSNVLNYCNTDIKRIKIPINKVDWSVPYPDYKPQYYDSPTLQGKHWADPIIGTIDFAPNWNSVDGQINRKSHHSIYKIVNNYPINPFGRTGLNGRGLLGRWGPNHAADPIVTKWKRDRHGFVIKSNNKSILQMCAIKRHDNGEWAIPGGMVDLGEKISETLMREFEEEALNSTAMNSSDLVKKFFENYGVEIYSGYVHDPRNTDNAWMETVAVNFHDSTDEYVGKYNLRAGDDAVGVQWLDIDKSIQLYANHKNIVEIVVKMLNAHW